MKKELTPGIPEKVQMPNAEKTQTIANHKLAATHHNEAAKQHLEAAKHHEAGNHDKASVSSVKANGHAIHANDAHKEDAKLHATLKK
jgi:hypothetical protein